MLSPFQILLYLKKVKKYVRRFWNKLANKILLKKGKNKKYVIDILVHYKYMLLYRINVYKQNLF